MGIHSDALRSTVAETSAEINHYQSLLQKLLAKRDSAQLELDSLIYPVLTLPPEITSEIFLYCLPTSYTDRERNSTNPHEAPLLLCHVCVTWRAIAFSTPALWATIDVDIRDIECVHMFKAWLDRAGESPLSVKLTIPWDAKGDVSGCFKTLAARSRTIHVLELETSGERLQDMDKISTRWNFPSLHTLSICQLSEAEDSELDPPIHAFRNSPLLRDVSLSETPPSFTPLPWNQLTRFTGTFRTVSYCLEVLRFSSRLTECSFALLGDPCVTYSTRLTHSTLQSLSLESLSSGCPCSSEILNYLALPALQTLHIDDSETSNFNREVFHAFLSRSSPPLRKFTFRMGTTTTFDVTLLPDCMPKLVDLEFWNPRLDCFDLGDLLDEYTTSLLPHLEHLSFLDCGPDIEIEDMLQVSQAAKRRADHFALEPIRLAWSGWDLSEDDLLPFQQLVAEGMDIRIQGESIPRI